MSSFGLPSDTNANVTHHVDALVDLAESFHEYSTFKDVWDNEAEHVRDKWVNSGQDFIRFYSFLSYKERSNLNTYIQCKK